MPYRNIYIYINNKQEEMKTRNSGPENGTKFEVRLGKQMDTIKSCALVRSRL